MTNNESEDRRSNRLLIFSSKNPEQLKLEHQNQKNRDLKIDVVGNTPALITNLNLNRYQLCLIDSEIVKNGSQILEIIRVLANYNIPILIRQFGTLTDKDAFGFSNICGVSNPIKTEEIRRVSDNLDTDSGDESRLINLLTATINHAVNSPLMAISANAEMILNNLSASEKPGLRNKITEIGLAAKKIETVLRKLRESEYHPYKKTPAGFMIDVQAIDADTEPKRSETAMPVS